MTNALKGKILKCTAVAIDVSVPLIATLTQFPVWIKQSAESTISGMFLFTVLAFISCLPFIRKAKEYLKSPSVWVLWTISLVMFTCLRSIIDQLIIVCFAGTVANIIGACLYKVGEFVENKQ